MKHAIVAIFFSFSAFVVPAQRPDHRLEKQLAELLEGFNGDVGVYVHDLKKNKTVAIHADTVFPTASMIKVPILTGIMQKIQKGELDYHQPMIYKDSLLYAGEDILGSFKNNEKIELGKVIMLMLTMSDNTASLWLQTLAGKGERINAIMDSLGLHNTRVNSRTPGRAEFQRQYGWGMTTPREMATLMELIVKKQATGEQGDEKMLKLLSRNYWDEHALASIPAGVFVASKNGAVDATRSEVLFVNGKKCSYIFCICTKNNKDISWTPGNEAWVLAGKLSKLLWDYYN